MTKNSWYKARGLVTVTAITVGWHMVRWRRFASGGYTVVARGAVIHDTSVVICGTDKGCGVMAHGAIFTISWKMARCQASGSNAIVARRTIIDNPYMIKHRWYKGAAGYMTDVAIFSSGHMRWIGLRILAGCIDTIMAGITSYTHDVGSVMVDKCTEESSRIMAGSTIFIGVLMKYCIGRAFGTNRNIIYTTIVARSTVIRDIRVCKNRGNE
jgi:hypothetical protein